MSYFAEPNFIVYDEWFDEDLEKNKLDVQDKKITPISNIHEFFYSQSNYKIGASENNMQLDLKINKKELIFNNYLDNILEESSGFNQRFTLFKKFTKSKFKFKITKRIIYSLSIFSFIFIIGFLIFFISQYTKNESNINNKLLSLEKKIFF